MAARTQSDQTDGRADRNPLGPRARENGLSINDCLAIYILITSLKEDWSMRHLCILTLILFIGNVMAASTNHAAFTLSQRQISLVTLNLTSAIAVVEGEVVESIAAFEHWPGAPACSSGIFTNVKLRVRKTYKTSPLITHGSIVPLKLFGGITSNNASFSTSSVTMTNGERCLVFIERRIGESHGIRYDFLKPRAGWKGVYKIDEDHARLDPVLRFRAIAPRADALAPQRAKPVSVVLYKSPNRRVMHEYSAETLTSTYTEEAPASKAFPDDFACSYSNLVMLIQTECGDSL